MSKKIGIIVQRYGLEVNGGAEYHARILAEQLVKSYEVTVLTTKALDYVSWDNHYNEDIEKINDVTVKRFPTKYTRNHKRINKSRRTIFKKRKYHRVLSKLPLISFLDDKVDILKPTKKQNLRWLKDQGPYCPSLIQYLEDNNNNYSCFIFFTYLYYPTVVGVNKVKGKSIFIPTAHDEPEIYASLYKDVFEQASFIMYNTLAEKKLVEANFSNLTQYSDIAGIGIQKPELDYSIKVPEKYNYDFDYFIYIGRIDNSKGCDNLVNSFLNFKKICPQKKSKLILVGKNHTDIKESKDVILTGFVNERVKYHLLDNAKALIIPSMFESMSMVTLEAMAQGKIVVANKLCEVLNDHIVKSESGFSYENETELIALFNKIPQLSDDEFEVHGQKAISYVKENYAWNKVLDKFDKAIDLIAAVKPKLVDNLSEVEKDSPLGINLLWILNKKSGLGYALTLNIKSLEEVGVPVSKIDYTKNNSNLLDECKYQINLIQLSLNEIESFLSKIDITFFKDKYSILFLVWESEYLPPNIIENIQFFDEIWTASSYCKSVFAKYFKGPIKVVPHPLEVSIDKSSNKKLESIYTRNKFSFLFIFNFGSSIERKNPIFLVSVFKEAFKNLEDKVELVIKASNSQHHFEDYKRLLKEIGNSTNIKIIEDDFSRNDLNHIIDGCDSYVSLHHSEGFGLTLAEAMYFGKPTIATNYSGNTEFMNQNNSFLVDFTRAYIEETDHHFSEETIWANPSFEDSVAKMRYVFDNPEKAKQKGLIAAKEIKSNLSYKAIGGIMKNRILEIKNQSSILTNNQIQILELKRNSLELKCNFNNAQRELRKIKKNKVVKIVLYVKSIARKIKSVYHN